MRFIKKNDRHIKDHVAFNSNKGVHLRFSFVLEDAPIPPTFDGLFAQTLLYSTWWKVLAAGWLIKASVRQSSSDGLTNSLDLRNNKTSDRQKKK